MINFNLLPWREEAKEREKKRWFLSVVLVVLFSGAFIFRCHEYMERQIAHQHELNSGLQARIVHLDRALAEAQAVEKRKTEWIMHHEMIKALQAKQTHLLYWFEVLACAPAELYFTNIVRTRSHLLIEGKTTSTQAVSTFMKNIVHANPQLNEIQAQAPLMSFNITVGLP